MNPLLLLPLLFNAHGSVPEDEPKEPAEETAGSGKEISPEAQPSPMGAVPLSVVEAAHTSHQLTLAHRMKAVSEPMLDAPYVTDPLGEGEGIDADPPARYDVFDCLTFVEEVMALSLAGDPVHSAQIRQSLRYGELPPTYTNRHHFMELQWIPQNLAANWLRDTTDEYGETIEFSRKVTLALWRNWGRRSLFAHSDDQLPVGEMSLKVLPLDQAREIVDQIPPGSLIFTVRDDRPWIPLWITHVGFTIPAEEPTIRHASRMKSSMRVRDHSLKWYLDHLATYVNWKTAGITIMEPVEPGPRVSLLPH
ncbi:MAG: DUF1460 domain-containing protein [Proteobacteria bacterium]|nr:DUF1460 domain-containing protein [Pseudomonadota bacterium]